MSDPQPSISSAAGPAAARPGRAAGRTWLLVAGAVLTAVVYMQWSLMRQQARLSTALERVAAFEATRAESPQATSAASVPQTQATPADTKEFRQAQALVERALAARVWGDAQLAELRSLRGRLSTQQMAALLQRLIPAINAQSVRVETHGPPF